MALDYYSQKKADSLKAQLETDLQGLRGITLRVKELKKLIAIADQRITPYHRINSGGFLQYLPVKARRVSELKKIKEQLMADPTAYFGTLDHAIVRKHYEYESLNLRQHRAILSQYRWIYEELQPGEVPALENDEWYEPLMNLHEKLSDKESQHFTAGDRMTMSEYHELKGKKEQPGYLVQETGEVVFFKPITDETIEGLFEDRG